ncbi:uncharacterized protein LOC125517543 [Triticum urartu]|uniref:uncharacterized protein LOC125517543 n=1 Tax=Triticum urartu TaxID=4572 RepID=UPI00204424C0|nr:uncharacterized protein LOC125517543 [Triticum urartu]
MAPLPTPWIPGDLLLAATAGSILPTPGSVAALHHRPPPVLRRRPWIHSGPASPIFLALPSLDPPAPPPSTMSTPPGGKVFPSLSGRAAPSSNSLPVSPAWLQYTPCSLQSARWSLIRGVQCTSPCGCGLEEFFRFILDFAYAVLLDPASSAPPPRCVSSMATSRDLREQVNFVLDLLGWAGGLHDTWLAVVLGRRLMQLLPVPALRPVRLGWRCHAAREYSSHGHAVWKHV